jgi:very-short-patch-repair endonuclease
VRVDTGGSLDEGGTLAWWVPAPLRLCLLCGVSYGGHVKSDFTKLATLGSEGRSTATTVLSLSAVRTLRADAELAPEARKLLSFTDNRQDAALQAGHFNDFVQVSLLRAGLYQALAKAGPDGLEHDHITDATFAALALPFDHFAVDPELEFHARTDTEKVLRDVLGYHLYIDLRRGWRVTSPNLEQCGLLEIAYTSLSEVCAAEHIWTDRHPVLASAAPEERLAVATTLLDHLRRELAIKVDFLDAGFQERLAQRSSQRLVGPWALDDKDTLEFAAVVLPRSRRPGDYRGWSYLSPRSGFARYLRRASTFSGRAEPLKGDEALTTVIGDLLGGLRRAGLVEEVLTSADGVAGYQVPASAMRWRAGEGTRAYRDPVRTPNAPAGASPTASASEPAAAPNPFFIDLYRNLARDLVGVEAREHTAQLPALEREARELAFRDATLAVLYCSPTMELGVDIAELNVVNLRNVPPTPANYAQRSGRAGRSGQPALVFTYCSAGSPHDQWFFRRPQLMVSGQVSTPRIDVANQDLVRAHVQAVWLAASGLGLGRSLKDLLEITDGAPELPLNEAVRHDLADPGARVRARDIAERVLADLGSELEASSWWSPTWLDDTIGAIPKAFDTATQRWRTLYRSASHQFDTQNKVIRNPAAAAEDKRVAKRLRREAEIQLELLTADVDTASRSDFYSYRYFASEGFLPGYSFPRLPLSAFIPAGAGRRIDGEFVSRPRFLAIAEFGPQSLVYHEGSRYQINRVILPVGDALDPSGDPVLTGEIKRCASCGYIHPLDEATAPDLCERCGSPLGATRRGMFRMHNVATRRRDRINSDEEERQRQGFELETGVRFAVRDGRPSMRTAEVSTDAEVLATLTYADTATLWRANVGRRRRANPEQRGFMLDIDRGYWAKESDDDDPTTADPLGPRLRRVIPYVEDTRNALLFEPAEHLEAGVMASLQAALKHAIQVTFQLEDDELATEPLPSADDRRLLLLFESAEGGAGVLRRLVDEPGALATVARKALELCHIDVVSGQDLGGPSQGERCEAACYECLLSYRNQLDHQLLDRALVRPVLERLAQATVTAGTGSATAAEHIEHLKDAADSDLERQWLEHLRAGRLRLPDRAQVLVAEAGTRPDFVYTGASVAVYVDGPHHLDPTRAARDVTQTNAMRDLGWRVIRFGHLDDWSATVEKHRGIFGDGA